MATSGPDHNPIEQLETRLEDLLSRLEKLRQENSSLKQDRDQLRDRIVKLIGQVDETLEKA